MKRLLLASILLLTSSFAFAGTHFDCELISGTYYCSLVEDTSPARLDAVEAEQVVQNNQVSVLEGEQAVQNDRIDDLEAATGLTQLCFDEYIVGAHLRDVNDVVTSWTVVDVRYNKEAGIEKLGITTQRFTVNTDTGVVGGSNTGNFQGPAHGSCVAVQ